MATKEELLQQLQQLKDLRNQVTSEAAQIDTPSQSQGDSVMPSITDVQNAMYNTGKNIVSLPVTIPETIANTATSLAHFATGVNSDTGQDVDRMAALKNGLGQVRDAAAASTMIPGAVSGARALSAPDFSTLYDPNYSPQQQAQDLKKELANAPMDLAAFSTEAYPNIRNATVGEPKSSILQKASGNDEIFANTLGAGNRRSGAEEALIESLEGHGDTFARVNPVAGVDPSTGRQGFTQFEDNLKSTKVDASILRKNIIQDASAKEAENIAKAQAAGEPPPGGTMLNQVPTDTTSPEGATWGIKDISNKFGQEGAAQAVQFMQQEFGVGPTQPYGPAGPVVQDSVGKPLSTSELADVRDRIDAQIREWGGYDNTMLAAKQISPSAQTSYISSMKFFRQQVDGLLKDNIGDLLGDDVSNSYHEAGQNYSMAAGYEDLAARFRRETGQAFTPPSAKAAPPGTGPLGTGNWLTQSIDAIFPDRAVRRMQSGALQREGNAISDLQQLINYREQANQPIPRAWAAIKNNAQNFGKFTQLAMGTGAISDPNSLANLPDQIGTKIAGAIAGMVPQAFEQTPDKVNVVDNQFQDSTGKDLVMRDALDRPVSERAKIMSNAFQNKYIPSDVKQEAQPPELPGPDLAQLNKDLTFNSAASDFSYDKQTSSLVDELMQKVQIHDQDNVVH